MIDEKKLIEELKQSGMIADNDYGNALVDMINSQPKIGEWIPCSERIPEKNGFYLVTKKTGGINEFHIGICHFRIDAGWDITLKFLNVIAWQPLPI